MLVAICLLVFSTNHSQALFDQKSNRQIALKLCETLNDFDCIESLEYRYPNTKWSKVTLLRAPTGSFTDAFGQEIENSGSIWSYKDSQGIAREFVVTATLNGEKYLSPVYSRLYPAMWFTFLDLPISSINSGLSFRLVLKASWLKPQGVGLMAWDANFEAIDIPGGRKYVFMGSPFLSTSLSSPEKYQELNGPNQEWTKSDKEHTALYFVVDHHSSIEGGTFWDPTCAEFGYSVTSHNAIGAGQPYMSDDETLRFNIGAPHRLSSGELNRGFFSTNIHTAYLDCRWPTNRLTKSPRIEVSVINKDGSSQVATSSVQVDRGILRVRATGFHYSSPTITIKASNDLSLPPLDATDEKFQTEISNVSEKIPEGVSIEKRAATKRSTTKVKCQRQNRTKVFTTTNNRCPSGWKKI